MKRKPFIIYHWSPRRNRASILMHGLTPYKPAIRHDFKPAYICFSNSPSYAWALSPAINRQIFTTWDLWMTWSNVTSKLTRCRFNALPHAQEYRVTEAISPRKIWFVGTRKVSYP